MLCASFPWYTRSGGSRCRTGKVPPPHFPPCGCGSPHGRSRVPPCGTGIPLLPAGSGHHTYSELSLLAAASVSGFRCGLYIGVLLGEPADDRVIVPCP